MKTTKTLKGFSSNVFLVEINNTKYVLKQCDEDEVVSEKAFYKDLATQGIDTLSLFDNKNLKPNELLLEYIEDSKTLDNNFTESNCEKWGEITKKIHNVKFEYCFKYNEKGEKIKISWSNYIKSKIKRAFLKSKENDNYGFTKNKLKKIEEYIKPLLTIELKNISLIHGDFHSANILIKGHQLIPFDKNPEIYAGDFLLDLAIAMVDMPNETLMHTNNPKYKNNKKHLNAFLKGYNYNFLKDPNLNKYIMLIAFGRLYTPFSENYKDIVYNLLGKKNFQ